MGPCRCAHDDKLQMHSEDMTGALGRNEVINIAKQSVDGVGSTYEVGPELNPLALRRGRQYRQVAQPDYDFLAES